MKKFRLINTAIVVLFFLLFGSCSRENGKISETDASMRLYEKTINNDQVEKAKHDAILVDSMLYLAQTKFENINENRLVIIKDYLFDCASEDASEGIADDFGYAFVHNDNFYNMILRLYDESTAEQKERLLSWLHGCMYFYIDTWVTKEKFLGVAINYDALEQWYSSPSNIEDISLLRTNIRNGNIDFINQFFQMKKV